MNFISPGILKYQEEGGGVHIANSIVLTVFLSNKSIFKTTCSEIVIELGLTQLLYDIFLFIYCYNIVHYFKTWKIPIRK